jgi:hypothetical protein
VKMGQNQSCYLIEADPGLLQMQSRITGTIYQDSLISLLNKQMGIFVAFFRHGVTGTKNEQTSHTGLLKAPYRLFGQGLLAVRPRKLTPRKQFPELTSLEEQ